MFSGGQGVDLRFVLFYSVEEVNEVHFHSESDIIAAVDLMNNVNDILGHLWHFSFNDGIMNNFIDD